MTTEPAAGFWVHDVKRHRWEWHEPVGHVLYWISDLAVGTEFDSPAGFAGPGGEKIPPLPEEAYR